MADDLKREVLVISFPNSLEDGQADVVRKRVAEALGPDIKVLVVGNGASVFTVTLDDVKAG